MRILCDTNVLLSALIFPGGPPDQVFQLVRAGAHNHFTSPDILTELQRILTQKFRYSAEEAEAFERGVTAVSELVYPTRRLSVIKRKDADNRILEAAVTARAEMLITGDKRDLLPLGVYESVRIISPRVAIAALILDE